MAMAAINGFHHRHDLDLDLSSHTSSTTTTTTTDDTTNWNQGWSPVVDWEVLSGGHHDDFHHLLFDSMIEDEPSQDSAATHSPATTTANSVDSSPATTTGTETAAMMMVDEEEEREEDFNGLRLVHLLMAAAEALAGGGPAKTNDLARVILVRLKEIVSPHHGSNMERLAAHFTDALHFLVDGGGGSSKHSVNNSYHGGEEYGQADVLAAFQLLQDMSPYVKFGHFTANQAILEAVALDRRIHIVDYDIMEGIQWASLMQSLVSRKEGPPTPHLRITALTRGGSGASGANRRSIGTVQETGRRLTAFAASIGQPFSFHQCRLDSDESFRPAAVKLVRGEALIMNCMLHLPHFTYRASESVATFLNGARTLNPRLVTLAEEELGSTERGRSCSDNGFLGRFMDTLHHYSAVYDSLEAGFPMQGRARALVERVFLGPRITGSLARVYRGQEKKEGGGSWWEWLGAAGFRREGVTFANHCQAKLLLGLFNDGYRVEEMGCNRLVLGWKSRRLLSASIWTPPPPAISDSDG